MQGRTPSAKHWSLWLLGGLFTLFVMLSSLWLSLMLWIQQPLGKIGTMLLIGCWVVFSLVVLGIYFTRHLISRQVDTILYLLVFLISLFAYFSIEARQDRDWNPEVSRLLSSEQQGDQVTLHNIRNFDWQPDGKYVERWESRSFDLHQITGVNIITSYWMGPEIAHTLVSFDFANQKPLTFSIEIRKEKHEEFSAIGGFFRKYELSLVASDEKDIVYTRSHIRNEQVYFFPVNMPKAQAKALFKEYLRQADALAEEPKWYNTLTSNCTTLVFDMVQAVSQQALPSDYRLLVSGYLPNYLYDLKALDQAWDMQTWYQQAHINPRIQQPKQISSKEYSDQIRLGLPASKLD
ncbi:DUF4105 domain-containing protein [Acinetobacter bohemicus]|uniref:Lnb N-terminal periplasmic domain-containing protein n=1 Tax=Acinetobacter sp. S4397-1 TaxID=2972915 RepID=UPI00209AAA05|nr:DUF4105 domain-containing protein [Acinetobacter sp. S4397-1]MCO8044918.1 DUF4105 domain-containing protein [Acinetobacter sp. S4397-1]